MRFKLLLILIFTLLLHPTANAATFTEVKSKVELTYTGNEQVSDLLLTKTSISIIGTTEATTSSWIAGAIGGSSDGFISALSNTGAPLWSLRLGNTNNEIATSAALDTDGSIWIVGASSSSVSKTPSPTPTKLLNPDNVEISPNTSTNTSLTKLNLWQVSASGQLLNSFETQTAGVINPHKILVTQTGLVVFGDIYEKKFLIYRALHFPKPGKYAIYVAQSMRVDTLAGMVSFGIRLEKNDRK